MKNSTLFICLMFNPFFGLTQLIYSKIKIYASHEQMAYVAAAGITIDHGEEKAGEWFITDLSSLEIAQLASMGVDYDILIADVAAYYAAHSSDPDPRADRTACEGLGGESGTNVAVPANFSLGSMGGYYTYEEFLAELDAMRAAYPDLITEKAAIGDFETWEGRPLHWVRISDNPETDEDEHEVLYTAIHHAREPMGLSQTIFYMWYLLENYGTDEEVTFLVDHTELYFVPMINPDGYKYNQTTNPGGGGMHRKNRNPSIGTTNKGVDLNRNYSYHWNESGTSPIQNNDTYAGLYTFSEPETQAIKWFCENRDFQFAFNAHSYGDLLLFPIGWATAEYADDHDYFSRYSHHMALYNGYTAQKATDLYPAAGDSDDWMYVTDETSIFAMTPEIGNSFWPSSSQIIPTCQEMFWSNIVLSHMPHVYGVTTDLEASRIATSSGYFNYSIERLGQEDGSFTISITALTGIASIGIDNIHTLSLMEIAEDSIAFELNADISFGDEIKYVLHTDNGSWTRHDTVIKTFGGGTEVFFDDCSDLTNWVGDWNYTNEIYYSPSNCITDSPYDGTYGNNVNKSITLNQSFNLQHASYAYVTFHAQWEIENDYDYVQFMISTDEGTTWNPLCGKYTNTGVADQDLGEPLYDGVQSEWVFEEVDLSDYLEEEDVRFRFRLITDGGLQMDGFYFDDFALHTDAIDDASLIELTEAAIRIYPNPANSQLRYTLPNDMILQSIQLFNELGQSICVLDGQTVEINLEDLSEGIYFIQFVDVSNTTVTKRFTLLR